MTADGSCSDRSLPDDSESDSRTDELLVAERDVVKCVVYFTEKDFDAPCPFDHPFATWAAWLWLLKFSSTDIDSIYRQYTSLGSEGDAYMETIRHQLLEALEKAVSGRSNPRDSVDLG